jgi:pimeloyl-ACP methyl ester carboxylesterase
MTLASIPSTGGVDVAVHDLGGTGPTLLLSHATGFHAYCYEPMAQLLADRFHSIALDYRGHGDTGLPGDPDAYVADWQRYGDDAQAVATQLRDDAGGPIVAFGHSMGGACLLMAAHRDPTLFDRLVLFEPIVFPPPDPDQPASDNLLAVGARRRRASFPSFEAAIANYAAKPPLAAFTPEALEAYVRHGFAAGEDGQVHLRCLPSTEAATFEMGGSHNTWDVLGQITVPVLVVAGRLAERQPSAFARRVADQLASGTYLQLDELDHFGPMTHPDVVADLVSEFAAR